MRLAAVSVDLDEVPCYAAIHGLDPPHTAAATAVYRRALARFEALFGELDLRATFFVIGRDLRSCGNADRIRRLHESGYEIGNHSDSHLYDLSLRAVEVMRGEVARCSELIADCIGKRPQGFRAPGYRMSAPLYDVIAEQGMVYDSSLFPCPVYHLAKLCVLALMKARGRTSAAVIDDPRTLSASADPYRVGHPHWRAGTGVLELPIGVTRNLLGRLPYIGTSLIVGGQRGTELLTRAVLGRPLVNLELHGIDLCDREHDDLGFLAAHRPDLRVALGAKERALRLALTMLRDNGYTFVTLAEAAQHFGQGQLS